MPTFQQRFKTHLQPTLIDLWQFIKRPNDKQVSLTTNQKIGFLLIILSVEIVFNLLIVPIDLTIEHYMPLQDNMLFTETDTLLFFLTDAVLLAPIIEESIFRLLLRYRRFYSKVISRATWDRAFPVLVYVIALSFGVIHIINYSNDNLLLYVFAPLIVLSQAVGGFTIAFIRVRLNFFWGVLYHAIWNFSLIILAILLSFFGGYKKQTSDYTLSVHEQVFYQADKPQGIHIKQDGDMITELDVDQHTFNYVIEQVYGEGKYYAYEDFFINVDFQSKQGISKQDLLQILQEHYDIKPLD